jgi:hypothetical protein
LCVCAFACCHFSSFPRQHSESHYCLFTPYNQGNYKFKVGSSIFAYLLYLVPHYHRWLLAYPFISDKGFLTFPHVVTWWLIWKFLTSSYHNDMGLFNSWKEWWMKSYQLLILCCSFLVQDKVLLQSKHPPVPAGLWWMTVESHSWTW